MIYRPELSELLLETIPIIVADLKDGTIQFANSSAEAMFGCTLKGMLMHRCVDELLPQELRDAHKRHRAEYTAHPRFRIMGAGLDLTGQRMDGTRFPVRISLIPAILSGRETVTALLFDMTVHPPQSSIHA